METSEIVIPGFVSIRPDGTLMMTGFVLNGTTLQYGKLPKVVADWAIANILKHTGA